MAYHPSRDKALIEKEAIAWFTRMRGIPSKSDQRNFAAWLSASEEHRCSYSSIEKLWGELDAATPRLAPINSELTLPFQKIFEYRREKRMTEAVKVIAGCFAVFLAGVWMWLENPNIAQNIMADEVTARAERRLVGLPDGSSVLLDADSALDVAFSPSERRVNLLRGRASFSVQSSEMPFVVVAAEGQARVLGTKFDVSIDDRRDVTVTLSSGKLEVGLEGRDQNVTLSPGQSVAYDNTGLDAVRTVDLAEATGWHNGRLIFDDARLGDVLSQIGRYRQGQLVVLGSGLRDRRVTGNIRLEDTEAALLALQSTIGFQMTGLGGKVTIIRP